MKNGISCIVILLFLGFAFTPTLSASRFEELSGSMFFRNYGGNTLYVGGSGQENYSRIQDAVDNASIGDTIFVYSRSSPYYENIIIKKNNIKLIGEDKYHTIVDGNGIDHVIEIIADGVTVKGFTIQHSGPNEIPDYDAGVYLNYPSHYNTITGNIIIHNLNGVCLHASKNNTISMNIIFDNVKGLLIFADSVNNIISKNKVENNSYGFFVAFTIYNIIIENNIANNTEFGIYFSFIRFHTVQKNNFINNTCHVYYVERLRLAFDRNSWIRNYWDTWVGFGPRLIKGQMYTEFVGQICLPWINFDWFPAHKPYTIDISKKNYH